jgi:hypothetical protein
MVLTMLVVVVVVVVMLVDTALADLSAAVNVNDTHHV